MSAARIEVGARAAHEHVVTDLDTAAALGSGSLPVLGTPRLLAWCEAATCAVIDDLLDAGRTSVGTRISLEHLAASALGTRVRIEATVVYADGRLLRFEVTAHADDDRLLASGQVTRVVVEAERFLSRL